MGELTFEDLSIPDNISFLILDDEGPVREVLIDVLREFGWKGEIFEAGSLKEAKSVASKTRVDFVLCDWFLPEGSGKDFLNYLKDKNGGNVDIPFLMISANDNVDDVIDGLKDGVSEYLIKPWKVQDLINSIFYSWNRVKSIS